MPFQLRSMLCAFTLLCASTLGQTVSSSLVGTVLDPANGVVPNAPVTLTDQDTGRVGTATTDGSGVFRFLNLELPGGIRTQPGRHHHCRHQERLATVPWHRRVESPARGVQCQYLGE